MTQSLLLLSSLGLFSAAERAPPKSQTYPRVSQQLPARRVRNQTRINSEALPGLALQRNKGASGRGVGRGLQRVVTSSRGSLEELKEWLQVSDTNQQTLNGQM